MTLHLVDKFTRQIDYLRISVTDRCNFRCIYCMNRNTTFIPKNQLLTLEELAFIGQAFVELGIKKIRVTGGEPLLRKNVVQLFQHLGQLKGLKELTITTNGLQLAKSAPFLKATGVKRINVSLDSLQPERFQQITRGGQLHTVLRGIDVALNMGFERIKLNSVILKNYNHEEVIDLVSFALTRQLDICFIETMPLGTVDGYDYKQLYYPCQQIRRDLSQVFTLIPTPETTGGPARYYRLAESNSWVGFIAPHSEHFCDTCNRVRVTTDGRLLLCLGHNHAVDLKSVIRAYPGEMSPLKRTIVNALKIKPAGHCFNKENYPRSLQFMNRVGG